MRRILLAGMTKNNRNQVVADVVDAVHAGGGWIIDSHLFSNLSAAITFAVAPGRLPELKTGFEAIGLLLDNDSLGRITEASSAASAEEIQVGLQITFIHNEPDLRRQVIAVPG